MAKKYNIELLANVYLAAEFNKKTNLGQHMFDHICHVLIQEIHYCNSKTTEMEIDCYKSKNSTFNKIHDSQQMVDYINVKNNNDVFKTKSLIADIYFYNLLLYDINDSYMQELKKIISIVHGFESVITDENIKDISKSQNMMEYKEFLLKNRAKKNLYDNMKKLDFISNIYVWNSLKSEIEEKSLSVFREKLEILYKVDLCDKNISIIMKSKYMEKYIQKYISI